MAEPNADAPASEPIRLFATIVTFRGPRNCPDPEAWRKEIPLIDALAKSVRPGMSRELQAWVQGLLMSGEVSTDESVRLQTGGE